MGTRHLLRIILGVETPQEGSIDHVLHPLHGFLLYMLGSTCELASRMRDPGVPQHLLEALG